MSLQPIVIDFKKLRSVPVRDRVALAQSNQASEIFGNLTPSQIAALFPDYYKKQISSLAGQVSSFGSALSTQPGSGGGGVGGGRSSAGGGSGGSGTAVPVGPPPRPEVVNGILTAAGISVETPAASSDGHFTAKERATLDLVAQREGAKDPNVVFGGSRYAAQLGLDQVPLTERSVADVVNNVMPKLRSLSKADGYGVMNGRVVGTSAVGTGQMVEGTLKTNLRHLGIPESEWDKIKFDKTLQERLTLANFETSGIGNPNDPKSWNYDRLAQQYESLQKRRITADEIARIDSATDTIATGQLGGTEPIDSSQAGSDTAINPLRKDETTFDPMVLDNLDPRVKDFYNNKASEYEKKALEKSILKLGVDGVNQVTAKYPTANPASVNTKIVGESNRFSVSSGDIVDVDPRLTNLVKMASNDLPEGYTVRAISGKDARSTGTKNHPNGLAMDVQIYNDKGELLKYDGNSADWKQYEKLYRSVYIRGKDLYPDQEFIWGGAWQGTASGNGDPMHYQIVNRDVQGASKSSGHYSFDNGLDPNHDFARNTPQNQLTAEERAQYDEAIRSKVIAEKQTVSNPNITAEPLPATAPVTQPTQVAPGGSDANPVDLRKTDNTNVAPATDSATNVTPLQGTTNVPSANSSWKLGGTEELGVANKVDEPYKLIGPEGQMNFNPNEEVNVKDGKATVTNEYDKKTNETKQKLDQKEPQSPNKGRMTSRATSSGNDAAEAMAAGYSPPSPSYQKKVANIGQNWRRGIREDLDQA